MQVEAANAATEAATLALRAAVLSGATRIDGGGRSAWARQTDAAAWLCRGRDPSAAADDDSDDETNSSGSSDDDDDGMSARFSDDACSDSDGDEWTWAAAARAASPTNTDTGDDTSNASGDGAEDGVDTTMAPAPNSSADVAAAGVTAMTIDGGDAATTPTPSGGTGAAATGVAAMAIDGDSTSMPSGHVRMQARQRASTASSRRVCAACHAEKPNGDFSTKQRKRQHGDAKCKACVAQESRASGRLPVPADTDMETD